jgi:hypothetical protein
MRDKIRLGNLFSKRCARLLRQVCGAVYSRLGGKSPFLVALAAARVAAPGGQRLGGLLLDRLLRMGQTLAQAHSILHEHCVRGASGVCARGAPPISSCGEKSRALICRGRILPSRTRYGSAGSWRRPVPRRRGRRRADTASTWRRAPRFVARVLERRLVHGRCSRARRPSRGAGLFSQSRCLSRGGGATRGPTLLIHFSLIGFAVCPSTSIGT